MDSNITVRRPTVGAIFTGEKRLNCFSVEKQETECDQRNAGNSPTKLLVRGRTDTINVLYTASAKVTRTFNLCQFMYNTSVYMSG